MYSTLQTLGARASSQLLYHGAKVSRSLCAQSLQNTSNLKGYEIVRYKGEHYPYLKKMALVDIDRLTSYNKLPDYYRFRDNVKPFLEKDSCFVSLNKEGKPAAFATYIVNKNIMTYSLKVGEILHLNTSNEERKQGHANNLLQRIFQEFDKKESRLMTLKITDIQLALFYRKYNFTIVFPFLSATTLVGVRDVNEEGVNKRFIVNRLAKYTLPFVLPACQFAMMPAIVTPIIAGASAFFWVAEKLS